MGLLLLLASLGGCDRLAAMAPSSQPAAPTAAAAPAPAAAAPAAKSRYYLADPPGFEPVGTGDGTTPAPIYVTISLNINDFLRPEREDEAVRRFLDTTKAMGIDPVELSFTGEVLEALTRVDAGLTELVKARRPTINEHYRLLQFRRIDDTAHEIFYTDPISLALSRTRPGPIIAIQKAFGVTPRDNGGVIGELLRRRWTQGPLTATYTAQGITKVEKNDLILHPDRLVAAALPGAGGSQRADGHEHVESYLTVFRRMALVKAGKKVQGNELEVALGDLVRWVHVAKLMGIDVSRIEGVGAFVDVNRLGGFMLAPADIAATEQEAQAVRTRAATDPAGVTNDLNAVLTRLCEQTCDWEDPGVEVRDRLAALDPNKAWIARVSWHASNDYTEESWSKHITGAGARHADHLTAATTRARAEQDAIIAGYDAVLRALKENPRVRFISFDNDTQWLPANAPDKGYPAVFGVEFGSLPQSLDPEKVDELARSQGLDPNAGRGGGRGPGAGGPAGGGPAAGGGRGGRPPGGHRATGDDGGDDGGEVRVPKERKRGDGARLEPRRNQ